MSISTSSRQVNKVAYNFSDAQVKVREATSNDPWGPSTVLMSEIADLTHNPMAFTEIMSIVWKRLNDSGNNWRHVYKSLVLLDFLIKSGHGEVAQQCRENVFTIETLKDFQHVEDSRDQGLIIREKADQLSLLLTDDQRLKRKQEFLFFLEKAALNADTPLGQKEIRDLYRAQSQHPVPTDPTLNGWFNEYRTDLQRKHRAHPDQLAKLVYILKNSMTNASLKVLLARFGISNIKKQQLIGYESKISLFQLGVPKPAKEPITPSQKEFYEQVAEEFTFDADLKQVIIHYLEPFEAVEHQNSLPEAVRGKSQCLFGNIRELYMLHHRVVLEDLVEASTTLEICQVLTKHRKQIYMTYRTYCQLHESNQKVRDSVKDHPFFKDCQRKANHNKDMSSYLLKPIQRIMKYQLLLGNIMKCCPADVKDEVAMTRDSMAELLNQDEVDKVTTTHELDSADSTMDTNGNTQTTQVNVPYSPTLDGHLDLTMDTSSLTTPPISKYNGDLKLLGSLRLQTECDVHTYENPRRGRIRFLFFFDGAVMFCKKDDSSPGTSSNSEPKSFEHLFYIPISSVGYRVDSQATSLTGAKRFDIWDEAKSAAYVIETIDPNARTKWIEQLGKSDALEHQ